MALRIVLSAIFAFSSYCLYAQSTADLFYNALMNKEYDTADSLLAVWHEQSPDDPEIFPAEFNYYINRSRSEMLVITGDTIPTGDCFLLQDSTGTTAGQITSRITWDNELFNKAICVLDAGIGKHPRRLDFRFGEAKAFEMKGEYDRELSVLSEVLDMDSADSRWLWSENEPVDGNEIIPESIFDYCRVLYEDGATDILKRLCTKYSETHEPDVMILNILAAVYFDEEDYRSALEVFEQAHAAAPDDAIILCNIAYLHMQTGDRDKALEVYRQVIDNPQSDPDYRNIAQEMINQLHQ